MKRFSNILFVSNSEGDESAAFQRALNLAKNNQARLKVISVFEPPRSRTDKNLLDLLIGEQREHLEGLVENSDLPEVDIEIKVLAGKPFLEIIREVIQYGHDLLIKPVENESQVYGGTDIKLLRKCPCPLWIIKDVHRQDYDKILVALDYEPENPESAALNQQLLELSSSLAIAEFAELHIVHAWQFELESKFRSVRMDFSDAEVDEMVRNEGISRRHWLNEITNKHLKSLGKKAADYLQPELHLIKGDARDVVPQCARKVGAELIIMGTVGRSGIPGFFIGNTAEQILNQIDISVLAIKPAKFVSPVQL